MMFDECNICVATSFCKIFSGEIDRRGSWCKAYFRLKAALELSNIPNEYLNANLYNYEEDETFNEVKQILDNIASEVKSGYNYLFWGADTGVGKTYTACCLLNHYIYKTCLTTDFDFETPLSYFISYTSLMRDLRYNRDDERVQKIWDIVTKTPLLLLDDVGAGTITPFSVEQTNLLIDYRCANNLSTIYTSNFSPKELGVKERLGRRTLSRMLKKAKIIEFRGQDKRLRSIRR